jgi:1,4-dihydroxy-2-naphthoyl-CoA hydrolase
MSRSGIAALRWSRKVPGVRYTFPARLDDLPIELDVGFDHLYGLELVEINDGLMRGRVAVRDEIKQPAGLVHGGIYAAVAESLATTGTAVFVIGEGNMAMGLSNQTSFLRPVTEGMIHAEARARHRGRTTWVWEVELTNDAGKLCALSRITVAVRPARPARPAGAGAPSSDGDASPPGRRRP